MVALTAYADATLPSRCLVISDKFPQHFKGGDIFNRSTTKVQIISDKYEASQSGAAVVLTQWVVAKPTRYDYAAVVSDLNSYKLVR